MDHRSKHAAFISRKNWSRWFRRSSSGFYISLINATSLILKMQLFDEASNEVHLRYHPFILKKVDIWALGCILYELAYLKIAAFNGNLGTYLYSVTASSLPLSPPLLPLSLESHLQGILAELLQRDWRQRPKAYVVRLIFLSYSHLLDPLITHNLNDVQDILSEYKVSLSTK